MTDWLPITHASYICPSVDRTGVVCRNQGHSGCDVYPQMLSMALNDDAKSSTSAEL